MSKQDRQATSCVCGTSVSFRIVQALLRTFCFLLRGRQVARALSVHDIMTEQKKTGIPYPTLPLIPPLFLPQPPSNCFPPLPPSCRQTRPLCCLLFHCPFAPTRTCPHHATHTTTSLPSPTPCPAAFMQHTYPTPPVLLLPFSV